MQFFMKKGRREEGKEGRTSSNNNKDAHHKLS